MEKGGSMNTFLKKILRVLAGMKSIIRKRNNSEPETYCQKRKREKAEEEMRAAEPEQKPEEKSGSYAY
jgi:hypothetical protein